MYLEDVIKAAAIRVADRAKDTAVAQNPRMHPDAASLIWANTFRAAREEIKNFYTEGFSDGQSAPKERVHESKA
jgi:hypothetical protein